MSQPKRIAISGGPAAGKSTALARIIEFCQDHGFFPVIIPEVATELISSGFDPKHPSFQDSVIQKILFEEELRLQALASGQFPGEPVFIYDRGLLDGAAYVESLESYEATLRLNGLDLVTARDSYDGVLFLHSAANGAEQFYTTKNNKARKETVEEARALNERTLHAWTGNPHVIQIPNRPEKDFGEKIEECVAGLARLLGVPEPLEYERKFVLESFDPGCLPDHVAPIDIVQTYLTSSPHQVERVRARGQMNRFIFFHTRKIKQPDGSSIELEEKIDRQEYENFLIRKDPDRLPIQKTRYCFYEGEQYCELDEFHGPQAGLAMLEIEVPDFDTPVTVPSYLGPYREETDNPKFANYALAESV